MRGATPGFIFLLLLGLYLAVGLTRPPLPIDETRYLTVAWEYYARGEWILPTLNYAPYHHKPPMLFWLIDALWQVMPGQSVWAARLVPLFSAFFTLILTWKIGRLLWPATPGKAGMATFMLMTAPFFVIYSTLIMFDTLLAVAVLTGIFAILKAYLTAERRWWFVFGIALGAGGLIKGPVILLHLLPVILLSPLWHVEFKLPRLYWWGGALIGIIIGFAIALSWALPAAKLGGPEYERMIFWGQSAGRMVQAFDHARPFWFYLALVPAFLFPWIFVPAFWRIGRQGEQKEDVWPVRFLMCWALPAFIAFMAISGKQAHYLLPLLPPMFLFLAHRVVASGIAERLSPFRLYVWALFPLLALTGVLIAALPLLKAASFSVNPDIYDKLQILNVDFLWAFAAAVPLIAIALYVSKGVTLRHGFQAAAITGILFAVLLHGAAQPIFARYYDLTSIGRTLAVESRGGQPVAFARQYQGELGFMARLRHPVAVLQENEIAAWLDKTPGGLVVRRYDAGGAIEGYSAPHSIPYRAKGKFMAILKQGRTAIETEEDDSKEKASEKTPR